MIKRIKNIIKSFKETVRHFGWISLIIVPVFIILNVLLLIGINIQHDFIYDGLKASAANELNSISLFINARMTEFQDDIHVIMNAREVDDYLLNPTPTTHDEYQQMLERVMASKQAFTKMKDVALNGDIIYQIERLEDGTLATSETGLGSIANTPYFSFISTLDDQDTYVSDFHLVNNNPTLTFVRPLIDQDIIQSYLEIEINASEVLTMIQNYAGEHVDFLHFGFINHGLIWTYDDEHVLITDDDQATINALLNDHLPDPNTMSKTITSQTIDPHLLTLGDSSFYIFASIHYDEAVQASNYYLLRYPVIIILINLVLFANIAYIAVMVKSKNNDRLLTNANIYLSDQSKDAVVITSHDSKITYINQAFLKNYDYQRAEMIHQPLHEIIGIKDLYPPYDTTLNKAFEYFNWSKTRSNIYLLKHLRIKSESTVRKTRRHYIYVYSEPRIEIDDYQKYFTKKEETLVAFKALLGLQKFAVGQTSICMMRIEDTDILSFANYIKRHSSYMDIIAQIKHNYLLCYTNHQAMSFEQMMSALGLLIERYRYLPSVSRDFSHLLVASKASHELNTLDKLLDSLLVTLEIARSNPQYQHLIYHEGMKQQIEREKEIRSEIQNGFINDEFYMVYQPQIKVNTGQYFGVEALLRWDNKRLGLISPNEFIPIIESSYLINQLSLMVLKKVIKDFEPYIESLPKKFRISVNITTFDFNDKEIIMQFVHLIESSSIPTSRFIFEITESHYIDHVEKTNQIVALLHAKNMLVAIDDFGTGYSSINSLKSINIDLVKIDRAFIKDYPKSDQGEMIKTIIHLIHGLHKTVIVEGTETQAHIDFCVKNHCEYIQGFYISKPIDILSIMKMIQKGPVPLS